MNRRRVLAAFLLSPLVGGLIFLILWVVASGAARHGLWLPRSQVGAAAGWFLLFPLAIGFVAEIVLGLPLLKAFVAMRWLSVASFAAGGFVIGIVVMLSLYWGDSPGIWGPVFCVTPAVVAAVFFGAVGGWQTSQGTAEESP